MSGKVGLLQYCTSAVHPVLEGLLHYTPGVLAVANESLEDIRMHSPAVNQGRGVWENSVFGKFNDRGLVAVSLTLPCSSKQWKGFCCAMGG